VTYLLFGGSYLRYGGAVVSLIWQGQDAPLLC